MRYKAYTRNDTTFIIKLQRQIRNEHNQLSCQGLPEKPKHSAVHNALFKDGFKNMCHEKMRKDITWLSTINETIHNTADEKPNKRS